MSKSLEVLDTYFDMFGCEEELSIVEARALQSKINSSSNRKEKDSLSERLLLGTLPALKRNIISTELLYLCDFGFYDAQELIDAFVENWVETLIGSLRSFKDYESIFSKNFFKRLHSKLKFVDANDIVYCSDDKVSEGFKDFCQDRKREQKEVERLMSLSDDEKAKLYPSYSCSVEQKLGMAISCVRSINARKKYEINYSDFTYVFDDWYEMLTNSGMIVSNINENSFGIVTSMILSKTCKGERINVDTIGEEDDFSSDIDKESFVNRVMNSPLLSDEDREYIKTKYGFYDDKEKSDKELSKMFGVKRNYEFLLFNRMRSNDPAIVDYSDCDFTCNKPKTMVY